MKKRTVIATGIAASAGLAVVGLGASLASAVQDDPTTTPTTTKSASGATGTVGESTGAPAGPSGSSGATGAPGQDGRRAHGRFGGPDGRLGAKPEYVADALGITVDELREAMSEAAPDSPPTKPAKGATPPTEEQRQAAHAEREKALADALDVSVDELRAAQAQAMIKGLQDRVSDGQLTQAEADEVKALLEKNDLDGARDELRAIRQAEMLSHLVDDDRITQAQANEIAKRVAAGEDMRSVFGDVTGQELPGPGGHRRGPRGEAGAGNGSAPQAPSTTSQPTTTTAG